MDQVEQTRRDQGAHLGIHQVGQTCTHSGAHDLENANDPDHLEFGEKARGNKSELIERESCHIESDRLNKEGYHIIDVIR